ncbi:hypothetical protein HXX76_001011 [Chlamydomonas incerta]|uniref:Rhodanese domain-containing protein n=1 Tax=Chlamydomonas incerta TaxID=51695 RepID=A0A835WBB6_CHLIN|nr:hypothetical protein HXX76_001011 [Chlamydomonas incerta]|eukprot:KAG2444254.1 hypothetical protein HXX76_001011 [Chlamydomonas incerta]
MRALSSTQALPDDCAVVDTAWLRRNLEGDVRIFDARGSAGGLELEEGEDGAGGAAGAGPHPTALTADYDAYLEGHVPGAVFVNWTRDGARYLDGGGEEEGVEEEPMEEASQQSGGGWRRRLPRPRDCGGGRRPLVAESDPDTYVPCFEARGLSAEQPVMVYDDGRSMTAARVWWSLLLFGHPQPCLLAGGWDEWRAGGGGSELYEPCPLKLSTTFEAEPQPQYRACAAEFVAAAAEQGASAAAAGSRPVAVLLLPEGWHRDAAGPLPPGLRTVSLSELVPAPGSPPAEGAGGAGARLLAEAAAVAMAAEGPRRELQRALRVRLGGALGLPELGDGVGARVSLASPHDASASACVLGAVLRAAGHNDWAVCDSL